MDITYSIVSSPLGLLLIATTGRGLCAVEFGSPAAALEVALRRAYPSATARRDDVTLARWVEVLLRHLDGAVPRLNLPVDVVGTPFQERVWEALRAIPAGATRSYGEIARGLDGPATAQEVAQVCAANPVALVVPCHRVVRSDGTPGGYRWGGWRKRALLAREARAMSRPAFAGAA